MADYRLTKCQNGWLVRLEGLLGLQQMWIAHTAAEAGEIIGREEGEHPILGQIETRSLEDSQEQED